MKYSLYVIFVFILLGCKEQLPNRKKPEFNFYHWSQQVDLSSEQESILAKAKSKKLYVRFFDVQWSDEYDAPVPVSVTNLDSYLAQIEVVPTIYITNEVMKNLSGNRIGQRDLAKRIVRKIDKAVLNYDLNTTKLQIDCDWTGSTKDAYFQFLTDLRQEIDSTQKLSATIRLHQIKYADKTGIPPVDEGALMVYNVGDVRSRAEVNSIFDKATVKKYLSGFEEYSLPLNIALPSFSWGVVYTRYGVRPINDMLKSEIDTTSSTPLGNNEYRIGNYSGNRYMYKGDTVRIEQPNQADIQWALEQLNQSIKKMPQEPEVIFYNIESEFTKQHFLKILTSIQ